MNAVERPTRVLLVDDDPLVRAGLTMILSSADDLEVVGEAPDGAGALTAVAAHHPDVVLMDVRMPIVDGLTATAALTALPAPPKVVVLTTFGLDDYIVRALEAGASGFLLKDTPPRDLVRAVQVVISASGIAARWMVSARSRNADALAESPRTTGTPVSPPATTSGERGILASRGSPDSEARFSPPPDPNRS